LAKIGRSSGGLEGAFKHAHRQHGKVIKAWIYKGRGSAEPIETEVRKAFKPFHGANVGWADGQQSRELFNFPTPELRDEALEYVIDMILKKKYKLKEIVFGPSI
jgi:hypothetical protein